MCAGRGSDSHKHLLCKDLLGWTYVGQNHLTVQSCEYGQHMQRLSEGGPGACLSRRLTLLSCIDWMHIGTRDDDGWRQMYYMQTHTHIGICTQIKRDNSKCLFQVYERGGQTPSSRSLCGHHVPSLDERSPVLGGWTETERGFFVLCNYTIVLALYHNLN